MADQNQPGNEPKPESTEVQAPTPEELKAAAARAESGAEKLRQANKNLRTELDGVKERMSLLDTLGATPEEAKARLQKLIEVAEKAEAKKDEPKKEDPELVGLRREFAQYKTQMEEAKKADAAKLQAKAHRAALSELVAESGLQEAGAATALLEGRTRWDEDKGALIAKVKTEDGEEQEVVVKGKDALKKSGLLPGIFWPAEGAQGSGARVTNRPGSTGGAFDVEKALSSHSEFSKNKDALRAYMRGQRGGT